MGARDQVQELRELGLAATLFRARWELNTRFVLPRLERRAAAHASTGIEWAEWPHRLPFADPATLADAMRDRISEERVAELGAMADDAVRGRLRCFGRWPADFGDPIDWQLNPRTGERWNGDAYWSIALADEPRVGDVKLSWEVARFPQAYVMARAAAMRPERASVYARALLAQIHGFIDANPPERGIHWSSGQELALRSFSWIFALDTLLLRGPGGDAAARAIATAIHSGAMHIERVIDYARHAVYNNHLVSEALGLYLAGALLTQSPHAARWRSLGRSIIDEEAERQFYADGAYIQLSHNYHRPVLQLLHWACMAARIAGDRPGASWLRAADRSIEFLVQHQNPGDGRLPNYGPNDGSLPSILSTCDQSDYRPTLQAAAVLARGERLYPPGPWDEEVAWLAGPSALDLPLRPPTRRSVSFAMTGFHVLRANDERSFVTLRCGSISDRFGQIDMLHVDVWWRGLEVLADGGSYLYNGPPEWHEHFMRTGSHNTVTIDGHDQMLHYRKFKLVYRTKAKLLEFASGRVAGEHYGYQRHDRACVHGRAVLLASDDLVVVVDHVPRTTRHRVRLHWLCGEFAHRARDGCASLVLETPQGPYGISVFDDEARLRDGSVVAGQESPPRGWRSLYYGEKVPVPSLVAVDEGDAPLTFVSVMGSGTIALTKDGDVFTARCESTVARFRIRDGLIAPEGDVAS